MTDRFEDPREQAAYDEGLAEVERLREALFDAMVVFKQLGEHGHAGDCREVLDITAPTPEPSLAEVERLREDRDNRLDQFRRADREADILLAEVERLREDLRKAIKLARDFNRGAMTWQEYDRKLAALEVANGNR